MGAHIKIFANTNLSAKKIKPYSFNSMNKFTQKFYIDIIYETIPKK